MIMCRCWHICGWWGWHSSVCDYKPNYSNGSWDMAVQIWRISHVWPASALAIPSPCCSRLWCRRINYRSWCKDAVMFSWMMCGPRHLIDVHLNPIFSLYFQIKENDKVVLETILSIFNPMLEVLPEQDDSNRCCFMLKPILCWCHTPASLTHSSSSDSLQGGRQLGCEAIIGLQRSAEKDNIVHCHFLYLSLGNFLTPARWNHGWKCFTNWIARTDTLQPCWNASADV